MSAFGKFHVELRYIEELHLGTMFAYDQTLNRVQAEIEQGSRDPNSPILRTLSQDYWLEVVAQDVDALQRKLRNEFPRHLRETLFVRVISIVEVFLVDTLREIFLARKDLFHRDERVELSHAQLLSFDSTAEIATYLINKECRTLQNAGFEKLANYFKKRLGIDFNQLSLDYDQIVEYHDRRHLLVHRLGRTDAKYRHDYNVKDERLSVTKKYLIACFQEVRTFADVVSNAARNISGQGKSQRKLKEPTCIAIVNLKLLSEDGQVAIDPKYTFAYQDQVLLLGDLLHSYTRNQDGSSTLELRSSVEFVDAYLKNLKYFKRREDLKIIDVEFRRRIGARANVPVDFLKKIEEALPEGPLPSNTHENIAARFGITTAQAKRAIKRIRIEVPEEVIAEIKQTLDNGDCPIGFHREIADKFGIANWQAYEIIRRLRVSTTDKWVP